MRWTCKQATAVHSKHKLTKTALQAQCYKNNVPSTVLQACLRLRVQCYKHNVYGCKHNVTNTTLQAQCYKYNITSTMLHIYNITSAMLHIYNITSTVLQALHSEQSAAPRMMDLTISSKLTLRQHLLNISLNEDPYIKAFIIRL